METEVAVDKGDDPRKCR